MTSIRISATEIDALRYFQAQEDADFDSFLAQMRGKQPRTPAMEAGGAFHKALEEVTDGQYDHLEADGWSFDLSQVSADLDMPAIREQKRTKEFAFNGITATLVGKVDAILGKRIDDHKLTSRFDAERFLSTYQWRIYLEIFDADEFRWNIFEGKEVPNPQPEPIDGFDRQEATQRFWTISAVHPLRQFRYPAMGEDVRREVASFIEFAQQHLPERFQ